MFFVKYTAKEKKIHSFKTIEVLVIDLRNNERKKNI